MSDSQGDDGRADLLAERDRLLLLVEGTARSTIEKADLPERPGIYVVWAADQRVVNDLNLKDVAGEPPLASRPFYVGKAEDSVRGRLKGKHFASGDTGHSTLRRTLASLLDLESRPRRTRIVNPTPEQVRTLVSNFDLAEREDDYLTRWMAEHLQVCGFASAFSPLKGIERGLGAELRPPLDQERSPMWEPNPWRSLVAERRRVLRERARSHL